MVGLLRARRPPSAYRKRSDAGYSMLGLICGADAAVFIKTLIPFGLIVLIPAIAAPGLSGFRLGKG